jgi:hypothetical protein
MTGIQEHRCAIFQMLERDEYGNYYRKIERKVLNRLSLHNLIAEVNKLNKKHLF